MENLHVRRINGRVTECVIRDVSRVAKARCPSRSVPHHVLTLTGVQQQAWSYE